MVSSNWSCDGDTFVIITDATLPPIESLSSRVSFESRYGTNARRFPSSPASAEMQFASANRDPSGC
jgi:hypothetical protein